MADRVDAAILASAKPAERRWPIRLDLQSGRVAVVDIPIDATDQELADLAAMLLGPIRGQCAQNRGTVTRRILVPS
jgi:hypothetical protein